MIVIKTESESILYAKYHAQGIELAQLMQTHYNKDTTFM